MHVLKNLNIEIKKGSLCSIIGEVGSGKSSLFLTILNEMKKYEGQFGKKGTISYVEQ
jgi:ATP-binding cassette subfamily C (CFTR/MRP) protein 4